MSDGIEVKIDGAQAREFVQEAILRSLDDVARESVIRQAVQALIERPKKDRYSTETMPSPLELAFQDAVRGVAREVVSDYLKDDEIREGIRRQIFEALDGIVKAEGGQWIYDQIGYTVGDRIARVLGGER